MHVNGFVFARAHHETVCVCVRAWELSERLFAYAGSVRERVAQVIFQFKSLQKAYVRPRVVFLCFIPSDQ